MIERLLFRNAQDLIKIMIAKPSDWYTMRWNLCYSMFLLFADYV